MPAKILLVDDEQPIVRPLKFSLEQDGYTVVPALNGEQALELFKHDQFDLVLLDLMLPGIDGIEVCRQLRDISDVPVIMLTAKGADMDKLMGLEGGADDYMTKPFNILEVKARIKIILRRVSHSHQAEKSSIITVGEMQVNLNNRSVKIAGREVNLTAKEFDLLQLFITNRGKVFDRESLMRSIWKYEDIASSADVRTVDVHIRRLREKIERNPAQPQYIFTKWGVGYYFTEKD